MDGGWPTIVAMDGRMDVLQLRLIVREGGEGMLMAQDSDGDTALHEGG